MIIKVLAENLAVSADFGHEHGLSLYMETIKHKILFDFGASNLCIQTAQQLQVDLAAVDLAFISHGHHDHGGGIAEFFKINSHAPIYVRPTAFHRHFSQKPSGERPYIGLAENLDPDIRFTFTPNYIRIDEELEVFSSVRAARFNSAGSRTLLMETEQGFQLDDFSHEQNLLVSEGKNKILIAGCAHSGIVNIIDHIYEHNLGPVTHVIGGFHLYNPSTEKPESPGLIEQVGSYLKDSGLSFFTCHCTGSVPFTHLREIVGEKMQYLATGTMVTI